jgi:transcriptional regulator GlxA family with amidase domain
MIQLRRVAIREPPDASRRVLESAASMRRRIDVPWDVSELATRAGLSASHYSALFRRLTGYSPKHYLTRLRIRRAARLLRTTDSSVKTIAATLGYGDPFYFSRTFRLVHGICPSAYRELGRGKPPPS